jgi:hypothetical protein
MKTSIIQFPGPLANGPRSPISARRFAETAVPKLRILRPIEKENLFDYAMRANSSRWESLGFAFLAGCALAAATVAFSALS